MPLCVLVGNPANKEIDNLYFRTVHIVIFILFKPTHALFLKHIYI